MICKYCGRDRVLPCRSTQEMEEIQELGSGDSTCLEVRSSIAWAAEAVLEELAHLMPSYSKR
jgi:hypothetical protein